MANDVKCIFIKHCFLIWGPNMVPYIVHVAYISMKINNRPFSLWIVYIMLCSQDPLWLCHIQMERCAWFMKKHFFNECHKSNSWSSASGVIRLCAVFQVSDKFLCVFFVRI